MINEYDVPYFRAVSKSMIEAGELGDHHVTVECQNVPADNMATLAPNGPYAFTIHRLEPGSVTGARLHIATTYNEVQQYYEAMHARVDAIDWCPITNVRGPWYGFHHGLGRTRLLSDGSIRRDEMLVLMPTFGKSGITGELYWFRYPDAAAPADPPGGPEARADALERHNVLLNAFRNADVEGVVGAFTDTCQTAICDYVTESSTLACLHGHEELRGYYEALFNKFKIRSVEVVQRVSDEWFVFCELLWTLERGKDGQVLSCNTAEYAARAPDGRLLSRIGHGTALAPVA